MSAVDPKKFGPACAHVLDAPEREEHLPTAALVDLLELAGGETVVDYGAGTGRIALAVLGRLTAGGRIVAVDESAEMVTQLRARLASVPDAKALLITANHVPLPDRSVDRVLAVNLLHESVVSRRCRRCAGCSVPTASFCSSTGSAAARATSALPTRCFYTAGEAAEDLQATGLHAGAVDAPFPHHFTLRAIAA